MKPKKGVMPPALKKYWAGRRFKMKSRTRKANPKQGRLMWRFEIQKGKSKLFLRRDQKHFSTTGPFALFANASSMQRRANELARQFPMLQGWKFYATPTHTYV